MSVGLTAALLGAVGRGSEVVRGATVCVGVGVGCGAGTSVAVGAGAGVTVGKGVGLRVAVGIGTVGEGGGVADGSGSVVGSSARWAAMASGIPSARCCLTMLMGIPKPTTRAATPVQYDDPAAADTNYVP